MVDNTGEDAGFLHSLLEPEHLAQCLVPDQELEAIKLKLWAMEQEEGAPELPRAQGKARQEIHRGCAGRAATRHQDLRLPLPWCPQGNGGG